MENAESEFYRTPDRDFCPFYLYIYLILSNIPVPALWEDKKRTPARRPHAGRTSIGDMIVALKRRHHVASQRIQDFLEAYSCRI